MLASLRRPCVRRLCTKGAAQRAVLRQRLPGDRGWRVLASLHDGEPVAEPSGGGGATALLGELKQSLLSAVLPRHLPEPGSLMSRGSRE